MKNHLIIMLRKPRTGRVKIRLGKDIRMLEAAWWFRHQTRQLLCVSRDPHWTITLAVSPGKAAFAKNIRPSCYARISQGRGDLGQRMRRLFLDALEGAVCIIGGDFPSSSKAHIQKLIKSLGFNS